MTWYLPLLRAVPALVLAAVITFSPDHSSPLGLIGLGAYGVVGGAVIAWGGVRSTGTERAILLKPSTFMNESGRSVSEAQRFYKIPLADVIVLHDELDLAPAKLRVKLGGGNAGHNGLRSISAHIGNEYRRVRLGIGHPGDKALVHAYVLNDFGKAELPWVEDLCRAVADHAALLAAAEDASFQNKVHLAMAGRGWDEVKTLGAKN